MYLLKPLLALLTICLILSCSRTKEVTSNFSTDTVELQELLLQWPRSYGPRIQTEYLNYYINNNNEFLFLRIDFKNSRFYEQARRFGFTVYFDSNDKFKRSFGITYPSGVVTQLNDIPGAQRAYFENPGWENIPENRTLIESIEKDLSEHAMLVQRNEPKASIRPFPVTISQLHAQGIDLALDQSSRNVSMVFKVPLQSSRIHQFALDTKPGQEFTMGFEIKPPTIDEIDPDEDIGDEERGRISYQLPSQFDRWVSVTLAKGDSD